MARQTGITLEQLVTRIFGVIEPEELQRQYNVLARVAYSRMWLTVIGCAVSLIFLPVWLVLILLIVDIASEAISLQFLKRSITRFTPTTYLTSLLGCAGAEIAGSGLASLVWNTNLPFSQAFALATVSASVIQLTSVRAVHLPLGQAGLASLVATVLAGNTFFWTQEANLIGLGLSSAGILVTSFVLFKMMQSNHAMHEEMRITRAQAVAADQAKSMFLARMSHELRTPLNAIIGIGEAERALATAPSTSEKLGVLVSSAQSLALILDDLLDTSTIQQGVMQLRPIWTDPAADINAAAALFRPLYSAAGLSLTVVVADRTSPQGLPQRAFLDAQRLRQCLSNLLSNALKHTKQGGVTLSVAISATGLLSITVQDSGSGVPPDAAQTIFEPFNTRAIQQGGRGLGLGIARSFAQQMGGDLTLEPSVEGACFCLTVALGRQSDLSIPFDTPSPAALPNDKLPFAGRVVLIVDDIATNRLVASLHLKRLGATVVEASSGKDALLVLQTLTPDLVLLDMNMPELSGPQTLQALRSSGFASFGVKVFAMTADATDAHRTTYLRAGMDGYIPKPLTEANLRAALGPYLGPAAPPQA